MMEFKFVYRCRLCGEVFSPCSTGSKKIAHETIIGLICGNERTVCNYHFHMCNEDDMGIAYFQGVKRCNDG
jgi:hypothetical protein